MDVHHLPAMDGFGAFNHSKTCKPLKYELP